jgi:hypothetical protein
MQTKWATVGGIMSIVSGSLGILTGIFLVLVGVFFNWLIFFSESSVGYDPAAEGVATFIAIIYGVMGLGYCLLGVLALVGGIFCIKRKLWGLALAGAIASVLTFLPTGVVAIVFTSMARLEFLPPGPATAATQA